MKKNYIQPNIDIVKVQMNANLMDTSVDSLNSAEANQGSESETVNYGNEGGSVWDIFN